MILGLMSGAFGLVLSTIGMDPMQGVERFMFGQDSLYNGINITCALIGLFSMSQAFILAEKAIVQRAKAAKFSDRIMLTIKEMKQITPTVIRSWIIGNIIGLLPGAGASIACFLGYNEAKRFSKHPEEFGKGSIEGIAGSEAANNAVTGGSLIPTLDLGDSRGKRYRRAHGRTDHPRSPAGTGTLYKVCSHDVYFLRRVCGDPVLHAADRPSGLPAVRQDRPGVRRHPAFPASSCCVWWVLSPSTTVPLT